MQAEAGHIQVEVEAEMEPQAEADKFQAVVEQIHQNVCMKIEPKPIREENQQEENGNRARPAVKKWNPRKEELHSSPRKKRLQSRILKLRKENKKLQQTVRRLRKKLKQQKLVTSAEENDITNIRQLGRLNIQAKTRTEENN
ncbi:uncharacterized protein LOC120358372 isoform X1 [Solenopsis invicta]|uniref:uncharacterized protein LOC120358372 isoform X1 n=1 Tax=Solenopsis invicta TaxID=13686 RepID=UPI00193E73C0|nr:uncharacterized protein LOC120358372 isoform X1 [Solenopsis invicta]